MDSLMLLLVLLLPLGAGVAIPVLNPQLARPVALAVAAAQVALGLVMALGAQDLSAYAITQSWLPQLGLALDLGLDGVSLPLVLLASALTAMAVLAAPASQERPRFYFSLLLATNLGVVGAFLARNALLFVFAYELILIPTTLLVASFGGTKRAGAAVRFLTYGAASGLTLLAAVLAFVWLQPGAGSGQGTFSFAYADLAQHALSPENQRWVMALVLLAFGLKLPVVPLHGWQPATYSQAPTPVAMMLRSLPSRASRAWPRGTSRSGSSETMPLVP